MYSQPAHYMRHTHLRFGLLLLCILVAPYIISAQAAQADNSGIAFIENKGQITYPDGAVANDVLYAMHAGEFSVFIMRDGISYQFSAPDRIANSKRNKIGPLNPQQEETEYTLNKGVHRFDVKFENANTAAQVIADNPEKGVSNYYYDNAVAVTDVHAFKSVTVQQLYPGIDWKIYIDNNTIKYDLIVAPYADAGQIAMAVNGADAMRKISATEIEYTTRFGTVRDGGLFCYQQSKAQKVNAQFALTKKTIAFNLGDYDHSQQLVIDPSLDWSTFYGGFGEDAINGMTVDADSNILFTGYTASSNAISYLGYQNVYIGGTYDCYVVKMDSAGNRIWATYFGGKRGDFGTAIVTTSTNDIFVSGFSFSTNFTTTAGAHQTTNAGDYDAFLLKFTSGGSLLFSTLFGGAGGEFARSVTLDHNGDVYLAGSTSSTTGIALGGWQNTFGGNNDEFLAKFSATGVLTWSTYLGGSGEDYCRDVSVDGNNNVYIAGYSNSSNGIAYNAFDSTWQSNYDCTFAKYTSSGTLLWATYYGGNGEDNANGVDFDSDNNAYFAVQTGTGTGLGFNGFQMSNGGSTDMMLVKFTPSGNRVWATYYGGFWEDMAKAVQIENDAVYVVGHAMSAGLGFNGYENMISGYRDGIACRFDTAGALIWATYAGGFFDEFGRSLAVVDPYTLYWGGKTFSYDFHSTYGSYQVAYGGGIADGFLQKVSDCPVLSTFYLDEDGDGYGDGTKSIDACFAPPGAVANAIDCDDASASRHPFITEICNAIDDDCDGLSDDSDPGIFGQPTWYADNDDDGYGSMIVSTVSCNAPVGFIAVTGDCDDANNLIHPAAAEICNGIDDDCEGGIDEDIVFVTYYADADADTYGNPSIHSTLCTGLPVGYVTNNTDCNDANKAVNPAATEICNGIDDECDGLTDENLVSAAITALGPTTFCQGSTVTLQTTTGAGFAFQWSKNGVNIAGATNAIYVASQTGNYAVVTSIAGGCSATATAVSVTVNSKPNPSITVVGDLNICLTGSVQLKTKSKPGSTYQWYKNAVLISGATSNTYIATTTGTYYVRETNAAGCFKNSASVIVTSTCKTGADPLAFNIAPNPVTDQLNITLSSGEHDAQVIIMIFNATGQEVFRKLELLSAGENTLSISLPDALANGMYTVQVSDAFTISHQNIMLTR